MLWRLGLALVGGALAAGALARSRPVALDTRHSDRTGIGPRLRWSWSSAATHGAVLACALVLLALALQEDPLAQWSQGVLLTCLLYGLAIEDLRTMQIPLAVVFGGIGARIASLALIERTALLPMVLGLFAGAGMLMLAGQAYEWARGRTGLGQGDAAVLGMIGCFVGWQGLVPALLSAALAGLLGGGGLFLLRRKPLDTPLPFAPFLAAGGWAVYLAQRMGWLPGASG